MAKKPESDGGQSISETLKSVGEELNPRANLKEHLMVAGVIGGILGTFMLGLYVALMMGVFTPDGVPPSP